MKRGPKDNAEKVEHLENRRTVENRGGTERMAREIP